MFLHVICDVQYSNLAEQMTLDWALLPCSENGLILVVQLGYSTGDNLRHL